MLQFEEAIEFLEFAFKHIEQHGNHFVCLDYGDVREQLLESIFEEDEESIDYSEDFVMLLCQKTELLIMINGFCFPPIKDNCAISELINDIYEDHLNMADHMIVAPLLESEELKRLIKLKVFI